MLTIDLMNEKGDRFTKVFDSFFVARKFFMKCKRSKKLTILATNFNPYQ